MRIIFCGTPAFAVPTLKAILADPSHTVVAVITQPDRPRGRGQEISFSPVKEAALAAGITVRQPVKIRAPEARELLQSFEPECFVIIAYGQIIPAGLLPLSRCGWINLHGSLLPKYRGAAPINWAIANGENKTGLTTMRIDAGMDTGGMLRANYRARRHAPCQPKNVLRRYTSASILFCWAKIYHLTVNSDRYDDSTCLIHENNGETEYASAQGRVQFRCYRSVPL